MSSQAGGTHTTVLAEAGRVAGLAPSIRNTQPWLWYIDDDLLELYREPTRLLPVSDPDSRLATVSCGMSLHHALVALAAAGRSAAVQRLPDPEHPDLLARVRVTGEHVPDPADVPTYEAIALRESGDAPAAKSVATPTLEHLRRVAADQRAHLAILDDTQLPVLAAAVALAEALERSDPQYGAELDFWAVRPSNEHASEPAVTRTGRTRLEADATTVRYAVLAGESDEPHGWLRGGEALSAVVLAATGAGLSVAPLTDVTEVDGTRVLLHEIIGGRGHPFVVLRIGIGDGDGW